MSARPTRIGSAARTPGTRRMLLTSLMGKGTGSVNGPGLPVRTSQLWASSTLTVLRISTAKLLATPLIISAKPKTIPVAAAARMKRRERHWRSRMLASRMGPTALVPTD